MDQRRKNPEQKTKSHRGHGYLSLVSVVCCCQVGDSATSRSLVQRNPTDCGVSLSVIKRNSKPRH
jgi:hypothetical protein